MRINRKVGRVMQGAIVAFGVLFACPAIVLIIGLAIIMALVGVFVSLEKRLCSCFMTKEEASRRGWTITLEEARRYAKEKRNGEEENG